jgi:fructokinase
MNGILTRPVLCFGEILWDSLPRGLFPGGAPFNAAFHLRQLGIRSVPVTAVGRDILGEELLRRLDGWGVETGFVSVVPDKPTGIVRVTLHGGIPSYEIVTDVAWDCIGIPPSLLDAAANASALIFGSLAQRTEHNRRQLKTLREHAPGALQVFDVNLRPPFDSTETIWALAGGADILKLNHEELARLLGETPCETVSESAVRRFSERAGCPTVCVTAGAQGAGLLHEGRWHWADARSVQVRDTVGAGDAFLAAFVHGFLTLEGEPQRILERACRVAEFVAASDGATPEHKFP